MSNVIPLSAALRERTRDVHAEAEGSSFIRELLEGGRSREDYIALVGQQYYIYQALEEVAETLRGDPVAAAFISPELTRLPAIEADLDFLQPDWRDTLSALPATERYAARIRETADWPGGFVAHHYTRYLGDLSGGQVIRTLLQRRFGFETNGVGFYLFAGIAKPKRFKDTYREQLDAAPWTAEEQARVVEEARRAFRYNAELFAELAEATAVAA